MTIARWTPPVAPTRQEQFLLKRSVAYGSSSGFCGCIGTSCSMTAFQDELAAMYRTTGAGKEARPPAMMAMAMLVQGYLGMSDAEMIELTVVDLRVQMVLGCLGAEAPPFSQGALQEFRERLIAADLDRRVLERTVELAKATQGVRPPQAAEDAARGDRFESAGGRGTRRRHVQLAGACGAQCGALCGRPARVDRRAGVPSGGHSPARRRRASSARSTSTGTMPVEKAEAITTFSRQLDALQSWIARQLPEEIAKPPLKEQVETLVQIRTQDLEPDPRAAGRAFARASRRIDASRSRTRRCVTAARARASGSMDSSGTLPRTSIAG